MAYSEPSFTLGVEEEYLLVRKDSRDLVRETPEGLMEACSEALPDQVSPEFLQCQIEIGTRVCKTVQEARSQLTHLRGTISDVAGRFGLAPIAASTHPFAKWTDQHHTERPRYDTLAKDLGGVVQRMLICGMHVHVCIEDEDLRIDIHNQLPYFLPHLLALSTSSPFWQGRDTALNSYRLVVFDALPRTGLPPQFGSFGEYERTAGVLVDAGLIEDTTKVWWDLRPSAHFPTLEMRICDVPTRLDDTVSIAALYVCITRMLYRLRLNNQRWRQYANFLIDENRWRAQRYGVSQGMIDFGLGAVVPFADLMDELIELVHEDAEAMGCIDEIEHVRKIVERGSSADRQRRTYEQALKDGASVEEALKSVVDLLIAETAV
ncbi:MAG: carboxylate-amine ligase [Pseudomonadota bacterium]